MIKLCEVKTVTLEDGRDIHFREVTLATAGLLQTIAEGDNTDFQKMGSFLHGILCDKDGKELEELSGIAAEDFYKHLPAKEGTALFTAIMSSFEEATGN